MQKSAFLHAKRIWTVGLIKYAHLVFVPIHADQITTAPMNVRLLVTVMSSKSAYFRKFKIILGDYRY